jgi:hypothetical protein
MPSLNTVSWLTQTPFWKNGLTWGKPPGVWASELFRTFTEIILENIQKKKKCASARWLAISVNFEFEMFQ